MKKCTVRMMSIIAVVTAASIAAFAMPALADPTSAPPPQSATPPQGAAAPPQGTTPPPQGAAPPSQGATLPPQGAAPPSQGTAPPSQSVADQDLTQIKAAYDRMDADFVHNNLDDLNSLVTSDYTETDPKGQVRDKAEALKELKDERSRIKTVTIQITITSLAVEGNAVIVGLQMHMSGTGRKKVLFFTVTGPFSADLVSQDRWIDTPGGWLLQSRKESVNNTKS